MANYAIPKSEQEICDNVMSEVFKHDSSFEALLLDHAVESFPKKITIDDFAESLAYIALKALEVRKGLLREKERWAGFTLEEQRQQGR